MADPYWSNGIATLLLADSRLLKEPLRGMG